jgi:hypothetical protein
MLSGLADDTAKSKMGTLGLDALNSLQNEGG